MGHFFSKKKILWNPYLYSVSYDKIENARPFSRYWFSKQNIIEKKTLPPEANGCSHPNTPIIKKKPEKYFFRSNLFHVLAFFGFVVFCLRFFFLLLIFVVILGLLFFDCFVQMLFLLFHVLVGRLFVGFFKWPF